MLSAECRRELQERPEAKVERAGLSSNFPLLVSPIRIPEGFFNVQSASRDHSIRRCRSSALIRFQTEQGDYFGHERGRTRSELQSRVKLPYGKAVWVRYDLRVSVEPSIASNGMVLGQFHQTEDKGDFSGYPPFELNLKSDGLHVFTASASSASQLRHYPHTHRAGPIPFTLGEYHQIEIRVVFGWNENAELEVWIDGNKIVDLAGVSIGMNDRIGPYWKFGIYYQPDTARQSVTADYRNIALIAPPGSYEAR